MLILPQLIHRFNLFSIKIPADLFGETDKLILKFIWKSRKSRIAKTILKKKSKVGELTFPNFKTYYKATVIKTIWYQDKNKHTVQQNRIQSVQQMMLKQLDIHMQKKIIFDPFFILYTIINLKWIKDLSIKAKLAVSTFLAPGTGFTKTTFPQMAKGQAWFRW